MKKVDNLHDFKSLFNNYKTDEYQIKPIEIQETIKIPKENYEKKLFITFYTLIRLWGKINFDIDEYINFRQIISKQKYIEKLHTCLIDNRSNIITTKNLELLIYTKTIAKKNNQVIESKINQLGDKQEFEKDINEHICTKVVTLTKIFDGSASEIPKNINFNEQLVIPSYLLHFNNLSLSAIYKYVNKTPCLIITNDAKHFLSVLISKEKEGWYFNIPKYDVFLSDLYKLLKNKYILMRKNKKDSVIENNKLKILNLQKQIDELKKQAIFEEIKEFISKKNSLGYIYTSSGLTIDKDKLFGIHYIDEIFDIEITNSISYFLKNLGDVGMAFDASLNGYHFSTTDNIAKTYFIIFNFYKFFSFNKKDTYNFSYTDSIVNNTFGYLL